MAKQAFLVDDSKSARIVLGRLLKKNGFDEVDMAESGEQALEQLKTLTPDAIFVDFLMDGMDGLETITEIKKDSRFVNTPIVMCTANEGNRYVDAAVEHGALGILAKPPTDESLKEIIRLIESRQREEQQPELAPVPAPAAVTPISTPTKSAAASLSEDQIREIAVQAARTSTEALTVGIAQEKADTIAREVARDTVNEMLGPMVQAIVDKRLAAFKPPEIDLAPLRDQVVTQVGKDLEEFVRQINERSVEGLIEASIYERVNELANDFSKRMQVLKDEILSQVPDKHEMLEHIRVVTEGSLEAVVRETATQVSQEVSNSTATETVEQILDEHLANQAALQTVNKGSKSKRWLIWLGLILLGGAAGYGAYLSKIFQ